MALIFSPLSEDVLEGPYTPIPKGVFLMLHLGEGVSQLESEMQRVVEDVLAKRKFKAIRANSEPSQKDYLAAGSVSSIRDLARYYAKLGDIALEAEDVDFELAWGGAKARSHPIQNVNLRVFDVYPGRVEVGPPGSAKGRLTSPRVRRSALERAGAPPRRGLRLAPPRRARIALARGSRPCRSACLKFKRRYCRGKLRIWRREALS